MALNLPAPGNLVQRVVSGAVAALSGLKAGTLPAHLGQQVMLLGGVVILEINGLVCADPLNAPYQGNSHTTWLDQPRHRHFSQKCTVCRPLLSLFTV